MKRTKRLA